MLPEPSRLFAGEAGGPSPFRKTARPRAASRRPLAQPPPRRRGHRPCAKKPGRASSRRPQGPAVAAPFGDGVGHARPACVGPGTANGQLPASSNDTPNEAPPAVGA
jgi:hypothetical protein